MKYIVMLGGNQYEVEVEKGQASATKIQQPVKVAAPQQAQPAAPQPVTTTPTPVPSAGGESVASPMPGTILSVKCAVGGAVSKGDVLFILEAMKMENEIFAPKDGVVKSVSVTQGATVDTGTVLCTL